MAKKKKVSDEEVKKAVERAASYKGGTWSFTEFNLKTYEIKRELSLRGATEAQIDRFEEFVKKAPIRGGGFNPYSGD
ncbi:MAG: hypothetical protein Q7S28_02265 [bacterium]|nr:hypothetical protein [bacterium]